MSKATVFLLPWIFVSTTIGLPQQSTVSSAAPKSSIPFHKAQTQPGQERANYAKQITVGVKSDTNQGSGTLIGKQGNSYLVLTNAHVLKGATKIQIRTHDGQTHSAQVIPSSFAKGLDLALVHFQSDQTYTLAPIGTFTPKEGQDLFTGGYAAESGSFQSSSGQVQKVFPQPLQEGYQIGYNGQVSQGMSGGPILEAIGGELIGIQGCSASPLVGSCVQPHRQDITPAEIKQLNQYNWGIPIQTVLAQISPQTLVAYGLPTPQAEITLPQPKWTGWTADLEAKAKRFTVRIDNITEKKSGSGVIIAKQGNIYTVLTAEHVLRGSGNSRYSLTTHDGQTYSLKPATVRLEPGVDLAVAEFESQKNYPVATLANYRQGESDTVFVAGFPKVGKNEPQWLMSGGSIYEQEEGRFQTSNTQITTQEQGGTSIAQAATQASFANGYDLVYTSITYGGMSGGPVLDDQGRVIGIHGQAEAEESTSGNQVIQVGNSLGIPINTFLGLASRFQVTPEQVATTKPAPMSAKRKKDFEKVLLTVEVPGENAPPAIWIQRGNQLNRLERYEEAIAAFDRAIQLNRGDQHLAYFGKAKSLSRQEKKQQSLAELQASIKVQPNYTPVWGALALNYRFLNQYNKALVAINQAIQQQPKNANLYNEKYIILSELGRHQEALAAINQALSLSKRAVFYSNRGSAYYDLKNYKQAIADCKRAIDLNPKKAIAYNCLGISYAALNDYPNAFANYNKGIAVEPDFAGIYRNRGVTNYDLGKSSEALTDINKAIELDPEFALAFFTRGGFYSDQKNYEKAITEYTKAIELNPKYAPAYLNRGNLYEKLEQYDQSIADNSTAIKLDSDFVDAYNNRGVAYAAKKQYQKALLDYKRAININPAFAPAYVNQAGSFVELEDYAKAIAACNKAIAIEPNLVAAYNNRGIAYNRLKEYPKAIADYSKAIEMSENYADPYLNRGVTYSTTEEFSKAISDLNQAIDLEPSAKAYFVRGGVYDKLKNYQKAIADYTNAIELDSDLAEAYGSRGLSYLAINNKTQAKQDLQRCAELYKQQDKPELYNIVIKALQEI